MTVTDLLIFMTYYPETGCPTLVYGPPSECVQGVREIIKKLKNLPNNEMVHVSLAGYGQYDSFLDLNCLGAPRSATFGQDYHIWDVSKISQVLVMGNMKTLKERTKSTALHLMMDGNAPEVAQFLDKLLCFS